MKMKFKCKVMDKRTTDSWFFGKSFYITVKLTDENITIKSRIREYKVPAEQYYDMNLGEELYIFLYRRDDGLFYPTP